MKEEQVKDAVTDLVGELFYYDRKEDEELTVEDMEQLSDGDKKQIIAWFTEEVMKVKS